MERISFPLELVQVTTEMERTSLSPELLEVTTEMERTSFPLELVHLQVYKFNENGTDDASDVSR
jgi:hypothetical protein